MGRQEAGRARKEIKLQRLCVCARARPWWWRAETREERARLQPGFCQLPPPPPAGRLLFLSWRLDLRHVAVLAQLPGLKEREPSRSAAAFPSRGRGPARPPPPGATEPRDLRPHAASARASFCLASAFHAPSPRLPRPCLRARVCGPCAGGGQGPQAQLLSLTGRRQVAIA